jgi:hypothetical protein
VFFQKGYSFMPEAASIDSIKIQMDGFITQVKISLGEVKSVAISQAWKILQLAVAETVQVLEQNSGDLTGPDKKTIAMDYLSKFYDNVFVVIDVPMVPSFMQIIIRKYIKIFLMALVSSSIDAMVTTFRQVGVFPSKTTVVSQSIKPKAKKTRKKK